MRLFFYGTLMSGESRSHVLRGLARRPLEASIAGDLYDAGYFPAYVPGPGRVVGEVFEVLPGREKQALAITDSIEGYRPDRPATSMYVREVVRAEVAGVGLVDVETYRWNGSTDGLNRIAGGSWRSYRNGDETPIEGAA
jgi:gamma-glutamylcyclotransferase (GGCT)/AIG2-like uncharacterized protein YtfP